MVFACLPGRRSSSANGSGYQPILLMLCKEAIHQQLDTLLLTKAICTPYSGGVVVYSFDLPPTELLNDRTSTSPLYLQHLASVTTLKLIRWNIITQIALNFVYSYTVCGILYGRVCETDWMNNWFIDWRTDWPTPVSVTAWFKPNL